MVHETLTLQVNPDPVKERLQMVIVSILWNSCREVYHSGLISLGLESVIS